MDDLDFINFLRFIFLPLFSIFVIFSIPNKIFSKINSLNFNFPNPLILVVSSFVIILTFLKFSKLFSGNYEFFDAGLILNEFFISKELNLRQLVDYYLFHGHFRPLQIIFSYIYKITESFYLIYFIHTLLISSSVIPLYLICKNNDFSKNVILFLIIFFLFNPIIGFVDILGFHIDTLVIPIMFWAFYFYFIKCKKKIIVCLLLLCLVSEVYMLTAAFASLVLFKNKKTKFQLFFLFILFFVIIFYYFLARYSINSPNSVFGGNTAYIIFQNFNLNNLIITFFNLKKFFFIYFFLLLFGFFFIKKLYLFIIVIPAISKIFLSTEPYHHDLTGHYANDLFVTCFIAMVLTLAEYKNKNSRFYKINLKLIIASFFSLIIANSILPLSVNFWSDKSAGSYNYKQYLNLHSESDQELHKYLIKVKQENNQYRICVNNGPFIEGLYKNNIKFINFSINEICNLFVINIQREIFTSGSHSGQKKFNENFKKYLESYINPFYELIIKNEKYNVYKEKINTNK